MLAEHTAATPTLLPDFMAHGQPHFVGGDAVATRCQTVGGLTRATAETI